jgi:uncharacterized protein GlcG (DUF336 family)
VLRFLLPQRISICHPRSATFLQEISTMTKARFCRLLLLAIVAAAWSAATHISAEELANKKALTLSIVKQMAAAAEKHARANQWNVCIAIVDEGGELLYFQRMDGVQIGSVTVSMKKAASAALFKRPTKDFARRIADGETALVTLPGALPLEGGLPIVVEGELLGAIGVSGVRSDQDGLIGQAALDALGEILKKK